MSTRELLHRVIITGFFVLIGFALAYAIYVKSFIALMLALISLGAAVYFLYILAKAGKEIESGIEKE